MIEFNGRRTGRALPDAPRRRWAWEPDAGLPQRPAEEVERRCSVRGDTGRGEVFTGLGDD